MVTVNRLNKYFSVKNVYHHAQSKWYQQFCCSQKFSLIDSVYVCFALTLFTAFVKKTIHNHTERATC